MAWRDTHRFEHAAMAAGFEIWCAHPDEQYARQAARFAFGVVDRLEQQLSRFVENSDISRINHLAAGEETKVSYETMSCLRLARLVYDETGGAFDPSIGTGFTDLELAPADFVVRARPAAARLSNPEPGAETAGGTARGGETGSVEAPGGHALDRSSLARRASSWQASGAVASERADAGQNAAREEREPAASLVRLDLGAIGKGFAVDRMADALEEWDAGAALVDAGFSSVLALEPPPGEEAWPLSISMPGERVVLARIAARQQALGASGIQKGGHIRDPRSGLPVVTRRAAWVSAPRALLAGMSRRAGTEASPAALADALSTAFMIMPREEIDQYCRAHPGVEAWILEDGLTHFS